SASFDGFCLSQWNSRLFTGPRRTSSDLAATHAATTHAAAPRNANTMRAHAMRQPAGAPSFVVPCAPLLKARKHAIATITPSARNDSTAKPNMGKWLRRFMIERARERARAAAPLRTKPRTIQAHRSPAAKPAVTVLRPARARARGQRDAQDPEP